MGAVRVTELREALWIIALNARPKKQQANSITEVGLRTMNLPLNARTGCDIPARG